MSSVKLSDTHGNDIVVFRDINGYAMVEWKGVKHQIDIPYHRELNSDNVKFIRNFEVGNISGIRVAYSTSGYRSDKTVALWVESPDIRDSVAKDGNNVRFTISGPRNARHLQVLYYRDGKNPFSIGCKVMPGITTDQIECVQLLRHHQHSPRGLELMIDGVSKIVEHNNRLYMNCQTSQEQDDAKRTKYLNKVIWQEIKDQLKLDDDVDVASTIIEQNRLINILRGKDVLQLTSQLDSTIQQLQQIQCEMTQAKTMIAKQEEFIATNTTELENTKKSLQELRAVNHNFKERVIANVRNVLDTITQ